MIKKRLKPCSIVITYTAIVVQTQSNIVSEYDQEITLSQTADKPVASSGRAT